MPNICKIYLRGSTFPHKDAIKAYEYGGERLFSWDKNAREWHAKVVERDVPRIRKEINSIAQGVSVLIDPNSITGVEGKDDKAPSPYMLPKEIRRNSHVRVVVLFHDQDTSKITTIPKPNTEDDYLRFANVKDNTWEVFVPFEEAESTLAIVEHTHMKAECFVCYAFGTHMARIDQELEPIPEEEIPF